MSRRTWLVAGFLFCSGLSALVYQTVWLREFRLIFGASTHATAAVLAIFMAGLGAGSAILGGRADKAAAPLAYYGVLEILIAASAALSPLLLSLSRQLYVALGGSVALGLGGATAVRIILSTLVLCVPTFLMGGTLPAAARAVETSTDAGRRSVAVLYGCNTLGAVTGTLLSTFVLLERAGNRGTLFAGVALNLVIGVAAAVIGRKTVTSTEPAQEPAPAVESLPRPIVLMAAAVVGFAFLVMELVWYRMLGPILGGTTFTFGLILAVALLGIGLGGASYALRSENAAPGAGAFAITCTLEATLIILPFALGDRLAVVSNLLRSFARAGFAGSIVAWSAVTIVVVLPAAFVSGVQFPLLIALLGRGREDVGRHVGQAYAWNTGGAIAGSLAGGFGLIPLLTAPGCWQAVATLLILIGLLSTLYAVRGRQTVHAVLAGVFALVAVAGLTATGPTAAWRHTGIGAGRSAQPTTINGIRRWINAARRGVVWEGDGRESSIAVVDSDDRTFIVNGKADGSATGDAGTQVMSGIIGAMNHPDPRHALVIGLGTGSTAGWLTTLASIQRVDVVELEPAVMRVAELYRAVNQDVLSNPKVRMMTGDAREVLLTTRSRYDIIFSEPSNPYRAGIASLYTREFYDTAAKRLGSDGVFLQWVQAYDIDASTLRTIYATIHTAFPYIETWQTTPADLILVCSRKPFVHDADDIRRRLASGYGSPVHVAWRVESAEGFLAHFIANDTMPPKLIPGADLNTDDRTIIEFGLARTLGEGARLNMTELARFSQASGAARPRVRGAIDWSRVQSNKPANGDALRQRFDDLYNAEDLRGALAIWRTRPWEPVNSGQLSRLSEALVEEGNEQSVALIDRLRILEPVEADALLARLMMRRGRRPEGAAKLTAAFVAYRKDPWPGSNVMGRALDTAVTLARADHALAPAIYDAMAQPFAAGQWEDARKAYLVQVALAHEGCGPRAIAALRALEPDVPWESEHLRVRAECYARAGLTDLARLAAEDFRRFVTSEPEPLDPRLVARSPR